MTSSRFSVEARSAVAWAIVRALTDENIRQVKEYGNAGPIADAILSLHPSTEVADTTAALVAERDALAKRVGELEAIVQVIADADSEDCVGSLDVDIPRNGYPRQWLRDAALAAIPTTDAGERAVATPVDDEVTRAFIDGWNARLDHTDFDMALHFWMLASVTHIGTPSTDVGEDEVERVAEALSPLVNEDMDADMRAAWLNDLARAAIAAIRKGER